MKEFHPKEKKIMKDWFPNNAIIKKNIREELKALKKIYGKNESITEIEKLLFKL